MQVGSLDALVFVPLQQVDVVALVGHDPVTVAVVRPNYSVTTSQADVDTVWLDS